MVKLFKKKIKKEYYTDLQIPVHTFYEVLKSGDTSKLYKGEKGKEDLTEIWKDIYNQYCKAAKIDNRHLKQYAKVDALVFKYRKLATCLSMLPKMNLENKVEACEWLKTQNYLIDLKKDFVPQFERCHRQLRQLYTKIQIEEGKLPKEQQKEAVSLMKQVISLENMFPGRTIDIYTMPMEKWLALVEHANEINKQRKKAK